MNRKFLVEAKKATYAGNSIPEIGEDGAKILVFEKGVWRYVDKYYNSDVFIGEEVLFHKGKPVWGMNYYGKVLDGQDSKKIAKFLRKALSEVDEDMPFRGPMEFKEKGMEYHNLCNMYNVDFFKGSEVVTIKGETVYMCEYHGGILK